MFFTIKTNEKRINLSMYVAWISPAGYNGFTGIVPKVRLYPGFLHLIATYMIYGKRTLRRKINDGTVTHIRTTKHFSIYYSVSHTVYPVTSNAGMFYQRGCKHLRRGITQGKKTCNLYISIVPIFNITFQTLCKRAFL